MPPASSTAPLEQILEALSLEAAAIRKKGRGAKVELRGGERSGEAEGSWLYRFLVAEDLHLRDDTPIQVTVAQRDVSGTIVSYKDSVLVVALNEDLGPRIAVASLIVNDAFLVERLQKRLEEVRDGDLATFQCSAAHRSLGLSPPTSRDEEPHPKILADGRLNSDQALAVRRSLGSDTTFVWGPPGTGKTTTLARIVEAHYRAGHSVLLVSNTNIAVDTALEKVAERLDGETGFHEGLVIRQGPIVKEELRRRFGSQVILEEIVARLGDALNREKQSLGEVARPLEAERVSLARALQAWEQLAELRESSSARAREKQQVQKDHEERRREADSQRARARRLGQELARAQGYGKLRRLISGLDPAKLERHGSNAERSAQAASEAGEALAAKILGLDTELEAIAARIRAAETDVQGFPPEPGIRERLGTLESRLREIQQRVAEIDRELTSLEKEILSRCKILATTVYRTYLGQGPGRTFDAVVIDEASMLMPPLVFYVSGLAAKSVTIAGDFRQLSPIVISNDDLAEQWLKQDVFERNGIPDQLARGKDVAALVSLGTQYRMREPICSVINELFYRDRPLITHPCVDNGQDPRFPFGEAPLLYVDTSEFHPWTAVRAGTYSRYNLFHALLVRNITLHLAEQGFLPPAGELNKAVGVVAPYASQARLVQALLDDRIGARAAGICATVHRFQGNQKRAMILDLTDSIGTPLGKFLKAKQLEEDGARLLNVAASRAQHHVVLVANFEYLRQKAPRDALVRDLLEQFEDHGTPLDLDDLLPLAEQDWVDGLHRLVPDGFEWSDGGAGAFTEGTFYPAFISDLQKAQESIVIFSPFATQAGTSRWVELLRAALARGVRVRVLTCPPESFGGGSTDEVMELVRALRETGVVVDFRAKMHEKIAILDGRVLWHGSLNILSHRSTHESMLRIDSPEACGQLARFLSAPTGRREDASVGLHAVRNPECPVCKGPTVWKDGRFGIWYECEQPQCDGKENSRQSSGRTSRDRRSTRGVGRGATGQAVQKECTRPGCGGTLQPRNGRFGPFLGCSNYPHCRHTEDLASEPRSS